MTTKILGIFPGQGSQRVGMGFELFQSSDLARNYFNMADRALGFSLSKLCFEGPEEELTATKVAQPAILTVSVICYELWKHSATRQQSGEDLSAAAGHSLGEYSALVASGAITFQDAVTLVHKRGSYMQEAVPAGVGKMAAILGKEPEEIEVVLKTISSGVVEIANINAPGQVVIAGDKESVDKAIQALSPVKSIPLPVSAPFHCALMRPAAERLSKDLDTLTIQPARFPIYCNVWAKAIEEPVEIREALKQQVSGTVRWVESMKSAILELNQEPSEEKAKAIEFGNGAVLSGLLKRIDPSVARGSVDTVESAEAAV